MLRKTIQSYILLTLNILCVLAIFLSLLGSVLSPAIFTFTIYFTLAFPLIVVLNIFFVIFWAFFRKWYFLLSLIGLLVSAHQILTIFPIHIGRNNSVISSKSLVLVSYNSMMNGNVKKHLPGNPNGVIKYLLSTKADIICIQEYYVRKDKKYLTPDDVTRFFKDYPYKYIKFDSDHYDSITGLATFSKYPIIKNERIKYKSVFNASIYSDIVINKDTVRVFNNHLESNRFMGNDLHIASELESDFNTEKLIHTSSDFSHKLGIAYPIRANQADSVLKTIKSTRYRIIVCGDFNDVPISYSYTTIKNKLNDAYVNCGTGFGWSYNSSIYKLRLDHIFYDDHFEVQNFEIGTEKSSDHFPVKCTLIIK